MSSCRSRVVKTTNCDCEWESQVSQSVGSYSGSWVMQLCQYIKLVQFWIKSSSYLGNHSHNAVICDFELNLDSWAIASQCLKWFWVWKSGESLKVLWQVFWVRKYIYWPVDRCVESRWTAGCDRCLESKVNCYVLWQVFGIKKQGELLGDRCWKQGELLGVVTGVWKAKWTARCCNRCLESNVNC